MPASALSLRVPTGLEGPVEDGHLHGGLRRLDALVAALAPGVLAAVAGSNSDNRFVYKFHSTA